MRWISERSEGLLTDEQSRGSIVDTELALDKDGKFLGLRAAFRSRRSAPITRPTAATIPITVALGCLVNTYTFPAIHVTVTAVLTNTMTIAPYRGGGRPEPLFVTETIIDKAAHQLGIDAAELRRRNTIPASAMPYTTPMRQIYDSGDFLKNLADARKTRECRRHRRAPRRGAESAARFWASASPPRSRRRADAISSMRRSGSIRRAR